MKNKKELMKRLRKDIKNIEMKIQYKELYNLKCYVIRTLIESGMVLDYCFPFILSAMILYFVFDSEEITPFVINEVACEIHRELTVTSTGKYYLKETFDYDDGTGILFEHTTSWELMESGFFERVVTTYRVDDFVDYEDEYINALLTMTKEEADQSFVVSNKETIRKQELDEEDQLYIEDMMIVTSTWKDENKIKLRDQTKGENLLDTFGYFIASILVGLELQHLQTRVFQDVFKNKLRNMESKFFPITKEDLEQLKRILLLKKENLELLDESKRNLDENEHYYTKVKNRDGI